MLKSVWLTKVIIESLNDYNTALSVYFRHLNDIVCARRSNICLNEPDNSAMTYIMISNSSAGVVSLPSIVPDDELFNKALRENTCTLAGDILYAPMSCKNMDPFGVIIFEGIENEFETEDIADELLAFNMMLYSEAMGGIIKSINDTAVRVENLYVDYKNGKMVNHVLKNVSFEIYEREFTVISGASGSGKSTLLNVIGGMLTATSGKVFWKDREVTAMTEREQTAYRAGTVGFVFQRYNLITDLTVEENIRVAAALVKDPLPAREVLKMVGLADKAKSYPSQLSGGEQQRVCIARALAKHSDLLLCDEPTGALDTENSSQIVSLLKGISKEQGIPVVVITHNPKLMILADHFITIDNGTVVENRMQPFAISHI